MDTKNALTCLIPVVEQIQDVRKLYDTAYDRWPPHFNINCFPFFPESQHSELAPLIQDICQNFSPMVIKLAKLNTFPATKKSAGTLYVEVTNQTGQLNRLVTQLQEVLFNKVSNFTPHVTLGRFTDNDKMTSVQNSLNWKPLSFTLTGLHLITRGDDTAFVEKYFFPFSHDTFEVIKTPVVVKQPVENNGHNDLFVRLVSLGDYHIYKIKTNNSVASNMNKRKIMNVLVVDNSGSMEGSTKEAINSIGKGMLLGLPRDRLDVVAGTVILFSERATTYENIGSESDLKNIFYPSQGQTNITVAIETAITKILGYSKKNDDVHYILTFLSDGLHNNGDELTLSRIKKMRAELDKLKVKLSIIVVGIIKNDTSLGMRVKTGLETVSISTLESVYYAKTQQEMNKVINQLNVGCASSLAYGTPINLSVTDAGALFMENLKSETTAFIHDQETVITIKSSVTPKLLINNQEVTNITISQPADTDISLVIDSLVGKLSQLKIATGNSSIDEQVTMLSKFIDSSQQLLTALRNKDKDDNLLTADVVGKVKLTANTRLNMITALNRAKNSFAEERNKLKMLKVTVENDSSKQAEYLTGMTKKYAAKAVIKSGIIDVTPSEVVNKLVAMKSQLQNSVNLDKQLIGNKEVGCSILSLCTPLEQLEDWLNTLNSDNIKDMTDIYSVLIGFGFPAYPVKFEHNNAVQMDPFQTYCSYIESTPIDTSTLMLANQMNHSLYSPARVQMTDGLILVDPASPNTSLAMMKNSLVYQYLMSTVLCRDLYMYHPKMTFASHAHALVACIKNYVETKASSYLELAVRIVYSIRKFWSPTMTSDNGNENVKLFKHWWSDWETITQAEKDGCSHPAQLLLMLAAYDFTELGLDLNNITVPLTNLLNEVLARRLKIKFVSMSSSHETKDLAVSMMQKLLGITPNNSPKPNEDVMAEEPTLVSVRESCQRWTNNGDTGLGDADILRKLGISDIQTYINDVCLPFLQTCHFGKSMQKYLVQTGCSWQNLISEIETESGIPSSLVEYLAQDMSNVTDTDVFGYFNVPDAKVKLVSETMFLQSALCHDSSSRTSINQKSIFNATTHHELVVDLRMAHYFEACKVKKQHWLGIIGDVTYESAFNGDTNVYESMIGTHTHGHCSRQFWALLRAAKHNDEKMAIFISKSNSTVNRCISKV